MTAVRISARAMWEATGASRGELILWTRLPADRKGRAHLRLPAINDGEGRARAYSVANLIETTLFKLAVDRGAPHVLTADFIERRFRLALKSTGYFDNRPKRSLTDFAAEPRPWLVGTEFDPQAAPYHLTDSVAYWVYYSADPKTKLPSLQSLHDEYLRDREAHEKGYEPVAPEQSLKDRVIEAINDGAIVFEIREPIRRALTKVFGADHWPGRASGGID